ncbi:hypothetical protein CCACVL1_27135 [Corchorus capsularis]|uniref:Mediator-associated protein 2 n=1 Tax=Corchorus capsularis TaxID=210143 RepID=A0A1R3GC36_COCAP|nr:hypothetical protein CCACVL1_27135 [Corchorus capsularis]
MGSVEASGYMPPPEFGEDSSEKLVDLSLSDSTELFLIQWPIHHSPEIDGKELTLQLGADGKLGSFVDSNGRAYELVSSSSQEPDATVIVSSASESKFVGKISRRVSLVHYMEPGEYESGKRLIYEKSSGTLMTSSSPFRTPMQSKGRRNSLSLGRSVSTHGSRQKSKFSGISGLSEPLKRKHEHGSTGSMNQSTRSNDTTPLSKSKEASRKGDSRTTSSGLSEPSHKGKSKKKAKTEE